MLSAVAAAGCSASIARFDNPSFALGEGAADVAAARQSGGSGAFALPPPSSAPAPVRLPAAPTRSSGGRVDVASLPPLDSAGPPAPRAMAVTRQELPPAGPASLAAAPPPAIPVQPVTEPARGRQVEVRPGDTLYGIAKRHKVMISDLMAANDLKSPNIKPGQKLVVPASGEREKPQVRPTRTALPRPTVSEPSPPGTAADQVGSGRTYTVKPGDSLYAIAARQKVKVVELQRINNITNAARMKPGQVLRLPDGDDPQPAAPPIANGETVQPESRIVRVPTGGAPPGVKLLNGADSTQSAPTPSNRMASAAKGDTLSDATPQVGKLRWPARGRVVQGFGPRPDGTHNDGVDIAVPAGTDVLAAESGVVAYAGNEVKTYGNLVLVRHDNGWVTAYAYNEKILVQRGDRVRRGQPIAKAGATGLADQPLVHFEVRVGSRPADPIGYLEKL